MNIWIIESHFGIRICLKYVKLYINRKKNLSDFHCFLLHKKILDTFEIIALLLKAGIICSNLSVNFCLGSSRYSMKSNFFNISFIAIDSNSLKKKPIKQSSLATFGKKMNKTPKNVQNDQISRIFGILRQNVGRKNT